jgi:SnoaL-like protein
MSETEAQWITMLEVIQVFNRYFRALDEKNFAIAHFRKIFTADAEVVRPNGAAMVGPDALLSSHEKSFARFQSTQHLVSGHDVTIDGARAALRANLVAMHVWANGQTDVNSLENFFLAGGVIEAQLTLTPEGWKISHLRNDNRWRAGAGFGSILRTDKL